MAAEGFEGTGELLVRRDHGGSSLRVSRIAHSAQLATHPSRTKIFPLFRISVMVLHRLYIKLNHQEEVLLERTLESRHYLFPNSTSKESWESVLSRRLPV